MQKYKRDSSENRMDGNGDDQKDSNPNGDDRKNNTDDPKKS